VPDDCCGFNCTLELMSILEESVNRDTPDRILDEINSQMQAAVLASSSVEGHAHLEGFALCGWVSQKRTEEPSLPGFG